VIISVFAEFYTCNKFICRHGIFYNECLEQHNLLLFNFRRTLSAAPGAENRAYVDIKSTF